jgi:hypothetical protein
MAPITPDASLQRAARVAGLAYLLIIVTSVVAVILTDLRLVVPGDPAATIDSITANESLYRLGAAYDLVMYPSVVLLSVALFVILRRVSRGLALLALLWRLGEAIVGTVTVLAALVVLHVLSGGGHSTVVDPQQQQVLVALLLNVRVAGLSILSVFISLGTIVFCYLFYRSRYIPRALSIWGMAAFLLMFVATIASILWPSLPSTVQNVAVIPVVVFEAVIGLWLLIRGIDVRHAG